MPKLKKLKLEQLLMEKAFLQEKPIIEVTNPGHAHLH